jgi:hypothetical protein
MRHSLTYTITCLLFSVFLLSAFTLQGSHITGVTMTYECLGGNVYRVHHKLFSHCAGVPNPAPTGVVFTGVGPGCTQPTVSGWTFVGAVEITGLSAALPTDCNGGTINGIKQWHYYQDYDFTGVSCTQYILSWSYCCRNPSITNIVNPGSQGIGLVTDTVNLSMPGCNNSPEWRSPPPSYAFFNRLNYFDLGAMDADGDSLSYELTIAKDGSFAPIPYNFGFSPTVPVGPDWDVTLDRHSGLLALIPVPGDIQAAVIVERCHEYRNGIRIGTVERDFYIATLSALPGCPNNLPTISGPMNVQGGMMMGDTLVVSPGASMCFDVYATDPDVGDSSYITWQDDLPGAVLTDTFGAGPDTVKAVGPWARVCWTAPNQWGIDTITITVIDPSCQWNNLVVLQLPVLVGDAGLVWPGDANNDLVADAFDLLPIGLAFGNTGPLRPGASNTWVGQASMPWQDTLAGGLDKKYVDCDGSGTINAADTIPINLNYGLTHTKGNLPVARGTSTDPAFRLVLPDSASVGDTIEAPILLGDSLIAANNVYGYAFTLHYDASLIDSSTFWIDFNNSWVGNATNSIHMFHNHPLVANCDASQVRTNHIAVSGMGEVCRAHFVIIDNIDGKRQVLDSAQLEIFFTAVQIIGLNGEAVAVDVLADSMIVYDRTTETMVPHMTESVYVYPNPVNEGTALTIESKGMTMEALEVVSIHGQLLLRQAVDGDHVQLDMTDYAAGLYFVRVNAGGKWTVRRVVVE